MREILVLLEELEALHLEGLPTPLDHARRLAVFVVNSLSTPPLDWDQQRSAPGTVDVLLQATGVPIDHYSYEAVELLRDTAAAGRCCGASAIRAPSSTTSNPALAEVTRVPNLEVYVINVSFAELKDATERADLNEQPTLFVLPPEAVDRLRAAAGTNRARIAGLPAVPERLGDRVAKAPAPAAKLAPAP